VPNNVEAGRELPKSDEKEDGREWRPTGFGNGNFCLSSGCSSDNLTASRGYAPHWGLCPQTRHRLAIRASHSCPLHIFTPGDASGFIIIR